MQVTDGTLPDIPNIQAAVSTVLTQSQDFMRAQKVGIHLILTKYGIKNLLMGMERRSCTALVKS